MLGQRRQGKLQCVVQNYSGTRVKAKAAPPKLLLKMKPRNEKERPKEPGKERRRKREEREKYRDQLLHQDNMNNRNFPSLLLWLSRARHYYEHLHEGCEQGGLRMHFTLFLLLGKIMLFICLTAGLTSFSGQRRKKRVSVWRSPGGPGEFCPQLLTGLKHRR